MSGAEKAYFVTGTDTDAGKTLIAAGLLAAAKKRGVSTLAIKPVAAGCEITSEGLRNGDALQLMAHMTASLSYEQVNPVAFAPGIAPHIAAQQAKQTLALQPLVSHCQKLLKNPVGLALIEGAGGWRLPLNDSEYLSGLPKALGVPVILVVGMKLGCLNHALLTLEAIASDGLQLAGWVANSVDKNMSCQEENLQTLKNRISAPLLGMVPFLENEADRVGEVTAYLDIAALL